MDDEQDRKLFQKYLNVFSSLDKLAGKRVGLVGEVSDWLVASTIESSLLKEKLGIELIRIPWKDVGNYRDFEAEGEFTELYQADKQFNIEEAGKVNSMLRKLIDEQQLDAITVECFSLVQENDVTACLSLSFLNDLGIPAGCEGDLCSIVGLMLSKELTGQLPWMANIADISSNKVLFAHCTAPTSLLSDYRINTHFETGKGTAVQGHLSGKEVSVFRLNQNLDKVFHALGKTVHGIHHENACRTQLHVEFNKDVICELKTRPLGNHHIVIPGNWGEELDILAKILNQV